MTSPYTYPADYEDAQIMEESTRLTFESPGVPTAATFIGQNTIVNFLHDLGVARQGVSGVEDGLVLDGPETSQMSMDMPGPISPESLNFVKRSLDLLGGTGTIDRLFSLCLRDKLGGVQYYLKLRGCMLGAGVLMLIGGGYWQLRNLLIDCIVSGYNTSAPTNWTFASVPTTAPLKGSAGGTVTIRDVDAGVNYTPSVQAIAIGWNRFTYPIPDTSLATYADIIPRGRAVNVSYILNRKDKNIWDVATGRKNVNSTIVIRTAPAITFTLTGGRLGAVGRDYSTMKPSEEAVTHIGGVAALQIA